jgi:UDP-glucuronate decarboxylase
MKIYKYFIMKVLVTGGAGFIGSNLCKKLLEIGEEIICMDNLSTGNLKNIEEFKDNKNFKFIEHDVVKEIIVEDEIKEIYHLACPASPPKYQINPIKTLDTNYFGTKNALELAYKKGSKILLTSTSEVYGDPLEHPQKEEYWGNVNPIGIRSCYDEGKRISETLMMEYNRMKNVNIRIARVFNTYGPKMCKDDGRVVSNMINQFLSNEYITIYGDGKQTRSFCYIDDLVKGLISLMKVKNQKGPVNLGNNNEITIIELCEKIQELIPESNAKIINKILPEDDPKIRKPDLSKAKELLKWEPIIGLEEGLTNTIEYFKNEKEKQNYLISEYLKYDDK